MTKDSDLTELANRFGSDKGTVPGDWGVAHGYTQTYERLLTPRRFEPLRVLELGVWKGASLQMWEQFLPNAQIIGVDNLADIAVLPLERAQVLIGDATDLEFLLTTISQFPESKVDIIIDDASHVLEHQIASLQLLFPHLAPGGLYFVEDIAGSRFSEGNRRTTRFRDFFDYAFTLAVQTTFFAKDKVEVFHSTQQLSLLTDDLKRELTASYWNQQLRSVQFFYNLCLFEKRADPLPIDPALPLDLSLHPLEGPLFGSNSVDSAPSSLVPVDGLESLQQQKHLLEGRLNLAESRYVQLASTYHSLKGENNHLVQWTRALEHKNAELQETDPQSERHASNEPSSGQPTDRARKALKDSWNLVSRFQAELASVRGVLHSAQAEIGVLRVQHLDVSKVRAQLKAKSAKVTEVEQSRADIQKHLDEILARFDVLVEQNRAGFQDQLEQTRAGFQDQLEQSRIQQEAQLEDARIQIRRAESEIAAARTSRTQLQGRLQTVASELEAARAESTALRSRLEHSQAEIVAAQNERTRLESKLANVESDFAAARKDITAMQTSRSWALTRPMRDFKALLSRR